MRALYDELAKGNETPFRERLDPQIVYWLRPDDPEPGPYREREVALEWIAQLEGFADVHTEAHSVIDAREWVVACVRTTDAVR